MMTEQLIWMFVGLLSGFLLAYYSYSTERVESRRETDRLKKEIYDNSVMYLSAVQTMEEQVAKKNAELELKQRVCEALNEEVNRLRKINKRMKGGQDENN